MCPVRCVTYVSGRSESDTYKHSPVLELSRQGVIFVSHFSPATAATETTRFSPYPSHPLVVFSERVNPIS